jgi:hypothetical protein
LKKSKSELGPQEQGKTNTKKSPEKVSIMSNQGITFLSHVPGIDKVYQTKEPGRKEKRKKEDTHTRVRVKENGREHNSRYSA